MLISTIDYKKLRTFIRAYKSSIYKINSSKSNKERNKKIGHTFLPQKHQTLYYLWTCTPLQKSAKVTIYTVRSFPWLSVQITPQIITIFHLVIWHNKLE